MRKLFGARGGQPVAAPVDMARAEAASKPEAGAADKAALDAAALRTQGNDLLARGNVAEAAEHYRRACRLTPDDALAHLNLGYALLELGDVDAAAASLQRAVALDPLQPDAHFLLGQAFVRTRRMLEARQSMEAAVSLNGGFSVARVELARLLHADGEHAQALVHLDAVLSQEPGNADALDGKSNTLYELGRFEEALQACNALLALRPDFAEALGNAAAACIGLKRLDEAMAYCDRALAVDPGNLLALYNQSSILLRTGRHAEVLAVCDRGLSVDPDHANLRWSRSLAHLTRGELPQGWADYEWRWKASTVKLRMPPSVAGMPQWRGESLAGKSLLLHAEQGLGDTLQFMRYVPLLAATGARIYLRLHAPIIPLCRGLQGCTVLGEHEPDPQVDYHCPMMSLALPAGTVLETIPPPGDWISRDPVLRQAWEARLGPRTHPGVGRRVGLAWSGNAAHVNDANRSVPLAQLVRAIPAGWEMISLQKDVRSTDRAAMAGAGVRDFSEQLQSFADTAALIDCMDLVVSVDTSVAHLAGALGAPLWVLLCHVADWRWLLDRNDSPWYPSARLFRQGADCGWQPVVDEVRAALR